ncbi:hypothetical protein CERZMDRAFT_35078 [Cercospora zeae-maydis SCOH1-5]|uniref:C2H2-type domain-containing protein n=1 Tax=Cercospora zeae-maydis SCOH1-5 TaxID=717836 RepID=A0A6A6FRH0_9PEZI|nr:hypothetical protein CERZMDRAFT_35078 [Cercospora zeae-maydis SCOH1-5]
MPAPTPPIDIATSRQSSGSPRTQQSNLTTQLQQSNSQERAANSMAAPALPDHAHDMKPRQESVSMLGTTPYGARQIPVGGRLDRRESAYNLSNSLVGGMSWGGISMGSFIRDDVMMAGTSPYGGMKSPSFHSSSYLPKMEANYMRDYVCCDIHLDSMHELLQHYEEAHAAQPTQTMGRTPKDQQYPSSRAANATSTAQAVQQQAQSQTGGLNHQQSMFQQPPPMPTASPMFGAQHQDHIGTFDNLDDMDMDDGAPAPQMQQPQYQPQPQFGRQQPRGPSVNVNLANAFQGQGLNAATPTTPHAPQQNMGYPHNPTVSSVNTPSLTTQTSAQQTATPDPSQPSTPAELDPDFLASMGNLNSFDVNALNAGNLDFNGFNMGNMNNGGSATIDNPEKRLLSKQGYGNKAFTPNPAFTNAQNSELAKRVRESQLLNGLAGVGGFVGEEIKPFKCPVIGCEKAYKNQNGLKYHKQHGHQNQQLKENPDGTFSIVDPATSIPYPGTVGMEKEKPYRCEVCGKRYKNLNGLKYHRQHSPPCNPDLKLATPMGMQNLNANVAGAGLPGMGEAMGY